MTSNHFLEITTRIGCKMMCSICPQERLIRRYRDRGGETVMSLDTFKTCVAKVPRDVVIAFSGMSEPFLNPQSVDMIMHAHDCGYQVTVSTTGVGLSLKDLKRIACLSSLRFFLHLPDKAGNARIDVSGQYLEVLEGIRSAGTTIARCVSMGEVHPAVRDLYADLPVADQFQFLYSRAGNMSDNGAIRGPISCGRCSDLHANVLLPNGDVLLCCMDYGMDHTLGNLLRQDYEELFRSTAHMRVLLGQQSDSGVVICRRCEDAILKEDMQAVRERLLAASTERVPMSEELDLLNISTRKIDDKRRRYYFLLEVKAPIPSDLRVFFHAHVKEEDREVLSPERQQYGFDNWDFEPTPPIASWAPGELVTLVRDVPSLGVSHELKFGFYSEGRGLFGREAKARCEGPAEMTALNPAAVC